MLLYLDLAHDRAAADGRLQTTKDLIEAIYNGAVKRIRPKMMTVVTTICGLLPIMFGTGAGSDVMKRIAAPMVGGLITSMLLELAIYPVIYYIWKSKGLKKGESTPTPPPVPDTPAIQA
jgi:Cu(I)/Ag(I) efflux system membrane protein CusA/SilA